MSSPSRAFAAGDGAVLDNGHTTLITVTGAEPQTSKVIALNWQDGSPTTIDHLGANGAVVSKAYAKDHDLTVGSPIVVVTPTGEVLPLVIKGIFDPPTGGSPFGNVTVSSTTFDSHWQQPLNLFTFITMRDGVTDANTAALTEALKGFPNAKAQTRQQFKDNQIAGFTTILNVIYVLLALSVVVSFFGIVNTLVLTVYERTRELGMLRAIGMTRRQVRRMIRHESVMTALIGAALGIALGLLLGGLLAFRVEEIVFAVPWLQLDRLHDCRDRRRHHRGDPPGAPRREARPTRSDRLRVAMSEGGGRRPSSPRQRRRPRPRVARCRG